MKIWIALAMTACGGAAKPPAQDPRDFPIDPPPPPDAAIEETEELPFVPVGSSGEDTEPVVRRDPIKVTGSPGSTIAATDCIPAGQYAVKVDLATAKLSQVNTGMDDIAWCKSMLEGIPATLMATLEIKVENDRLSLEWPPGKPQTIVSTGACSIGVTSPPMIATITFDKSGKAAGATSYSVGATNHPDESCSAVGAKLALQKK